MAFFCGTCCSSRAFTLLSTQKTCSSADYCTYRGCGAALRSQHLKTLLPTAVRGEKGYLPPPDISLPSVLRPLSQCIINSSSAHWLHFASPVVAGSAQVHCCNSASSSKPELKHSCCLGTAGPCSSPITLPAPGTGADWVFLHVQSPNTTTPPFRAGDQHCCCPHLLPIMPKPALPFQHGSLALLLI